MSTELKQIDPALTVNEVIRQFPQTLGVFNELGIDSCCGGGLPLVVVSERHGIALDTLLARLNDLLNA